MTSAGLLLRAPARRRLLTVLAPTVLAVIAGSVPAAGATTLPEVRGGRLTGPLAIAGGSTLRPVARVSLGRGDWTVFAKGVIRNKTPDLHVLRHAVCVLSIGTTTTPVQAAPTGADDASRTMPFLISVSRRLTGPGSARLRCDAPGSVTGALAIEDLRLVAMRTAALWTAGLTGPYVRHGSATSATMALERHAAAPVAIPALTGDVAALDVPAGSWSFTVSGTMVGGSGDVDVDCVLAAGDFDTATVPISADGALADRRPFTLEMVHAFPAGGSAWLRCGRGGGATASIAGLRLVAIRARTLVNASFSGEFTYPGLGGAARPVVDAGYLDGPVEVAADSTQQLIAKMKLPAGRWLILGKLLLDETTSAGWPVVECVLDTGTGTDRTRMRLAPSSTMDRLQPVMLAWHGRLVPGAQVNVLCRNDTPAVTVSWLKLTAYQVGTLSTVSIRVP